MWVSVIEFTSCHIKPPDFQPLDWNRIFRFIQMLLGFRWLTALITVVNNLSSCLRLDKEVPYTHFSQLHKGRGVVRWSWITLLVNFLIHIYQFIYLKTMNQTRMDVFCIVKSRTILLKSCLVFKFSSFCLDVWAKNFIIVPLASVTIRMIWTYRSIGVQRTPGRYLFI